MSLLLRTLHKNAMLGVRFDYKIKVVFAWIRKKLPKILFIAILVFTCFYMLLHPIAKIRLKLLLTHNCTIQVISDKYTSDYIRIDGNWMQIGSTYYEFDGDNIYRYSMDFDGNWVKREYSGDSAFIDGESNASLLDVRSYKRVKGKLFVWEPDPDVINVTDELTNVTLRRDRGIISIVGYYGRDRVSFRFYRFGLTHIDLPWEEK